MGAVPVGQIVARYAADVDLQSCGSGNIGATNVARVVGRRAGVVTLVADVAKGAVPVFASAWILNWGAFGWMCGVLAVLGHCYTPFLRWRGGKGVATSLGVLAVALPSVALLTVLCWLAVVGVTRRSSLGALVALPAVVVLTVWLSPGDVPWACTLAVLVLVRHTENIRRLLAGAEPSVSDSSVQEPAES